MTVNGGWGPQPNGGVVPPPERVNWWASVLLLSWIWIVLSFAKVIDQSTFATGVKVAAGLAALVGVTSGWRRHGPSARQLPWIIAVLCCANPPAVLTYFVGYLVGRIGNALFGGTQAVRGAGNRGSELAQIANAKHDIVLDRLYSAASRQFGRPGAHLGWFDEQYVSSNPRGATLAIGPQGSGKTAGVIIPSVISAPGACVTSSTKLDILNATWHVRSVMGRVWHFDPGGVELTPSGVIPARWSPLVGIRSWDDARAAADSLVEPMRAGVSDNDGHFLDRARDWCEVLLYAAHLDGLDVTAVADMALSPDSEAVQATVNGALDHAADHGDEGARIAAAQHRGLQRTPDKERGSIMSTLLRIVRVYGSVAARKIGQQPNFNPYDFVRSTDTLYITATARRQREYAPIIVGLLEAIRYARFELHAAEEAHGGAKHSHTSFILDEINNTAPIPLPSLLSEAGGQSVHVLAGLQDLSRARARWGKEADGLLTLFPTKLLFSGITEETTLNALSRASGEYDRVITSYSQSTTYVGRKPVTMNNPSWSMQRQAVLHPWRVPGTSVRV